MTDVPDEKSGTGFLEVFSGKHGGFCGGAAATVYKRIFLLLDVFGFYVVGVRVLLLLLRRK